MTDSTQRTVLIVDDEPDLCEVLALHLSAMGYKIRSARDGAAALDAIATDKVDLVVTDIRMPRCDGMELVGRLKEVNVHTPMTILISAYADVSTEQALDHGAEALLAKPFRLTELVGVIQRLLLPPIERWATAPEGPPDATIDRCVPSLAPDGKTTGLGLGRGGLCLLVSESELERGHRVAFRIEIERGPCARIEGTGRVLWERYAGTAREPAACGIEFEYIEEDVRVPFVQWLTGQDFRPYIPSL